MLSYKFRLVFILASVLLAACNGTPPPAGEGLNVVASTTLIGDVAAQIGGDLINVRILFPAGVDPHTFNPRPEDVVAISEADVIFINGLGLEEALEPTLEANARGEIIPVSEGVEVLEFVVSTHGGDHEGDPHTWTNPNNVIIWCQNMASALSKADPANAETYQTNADAYIGELRNLDAWIRAQVETIPAEKRELVTDHASFGYFAHEYGFDQLGLVVAASSTNASPSAQEIAQLVDSIKAHDVQAIFVGTTVNPALSKQVAQDTGAQIVFVYTGSLSEPGGEADSYLAFMRFNVNAIVEALR